MHIENPRNFLTEMEGKVSADRAYLFFVEASFPFQIHLFTIKKIIIISLLIIVDSREGSIEFFIHIDSLLLKLELRYSNFPAKNQRPSSAVSNTDRSLL